MSRFFFKRKKRLALICSSFISVITGGVWLISLLIKNSKTK